MGASVTGAGVSAALLLALASPAWAEPAGASVLVRLREGARLGLARYRALGVQELRDVGSLVPRLEQLVLPEGRMATVLAALRADPAVEYAHPDQRMRALEDPPLAPAPAEPEPPVEDPDLDKLWGMRKVSAPQAWESWKNGRAVTVAIVDSGIDYNHEDLALNLWRGTDGARGETIGYDFMNGDALPFDDSGHGTHVAGVIGAAGGNGVGISGVAPKAALMALKFMNAKGGLTSDAIRSLAFAAGHGARIINASWGAPVSTTEPDENRALREAVEQLRARGILFVAAAGNFGFSNDGPNQVVPASYDSDNVVSVIGTDVFDRLDIFSNFGAVSTDLAAPGVGIYSTLPAVYGKRSGTSMAAPHVTGAAALLWSRHPDWNYLQIKNALMATVDPVPRLQGVTASGGRLNVAKALEFRSME
jgi:serine protease